MPAFEGFEAYLGMVVLAQSVSMSATPVFDTEIALKKFGKSVATILGGSPCASIITTAGGATAYHKATNDPSATCMNGTSSFSADLRNPQCSRVDHETHTGTPAERKALNPVGSFAPDGILRSIRLRSLLVAICYAGG